MHFVIEQRDEGSIRVLKLNRPDKANALTSGMLSVLIDEVEDAIAQGTVNVLVLTGEGRVFSAGADLDEAGSGLAVSPLWERLSGLIANAPLLTIAALNGTVAGGAMGMVLACDLRVSVPGAKFFYPVMKLGFLPQPSDPIRLTQLVGPARAKLILMAGVKATTEEAMAWGLVDAVSENPVEKARELAEDASQADIGHVAGIKGLFRNFREH